MCPRCDKPACTVHDDHPQYPGTIVMTTTSRSETVVAQRRWTTEYSTVPLVYADVPVVCVGCEAEGTVTLDELAEAVRTAMRPQRRNPVRRAFRPESTTGNA
ncbi:MAG: hypothetical protein ACRD03_01875 [Acidimicrobiales bacterium]